MYDTAQKRERGVILEGGLKAGDAVTLKGHSDPIMVIEYILESPAGKVARCKKGLFLLEILKKVE